MKRLFGVFIALQFANLVWGFTPSSSLARLPVRWNEATTLPILRTIGNDDISDTGPSPSEKGSNADNDGGPEMKRKTKPTSARIGGRRKRARDGITPEVPTKGNNPKSNSNFLSKFRTPALIGLLLLLLRGFFSDGETSSYYYSYSSTVYETRTYESGGEVKTSRSESRSFKTNIPGMERDGAKFDETIMFGDDEYYDDGEF